MKGIADLGHLAQPEQRLSVRVTPRASRNAVLAPETPDAPIRVLVTTAPEAGKANAAVQKLLARALGVAPGRLTLLRGAAARDKTFRLD